MQTIEPAFNEYSSISTISSNLNEIPLVVNANEEIAAPPVINVHQEDQAPSVIDAQQEIIKLPDGVIQENTIFNDDAAGNANQVDDAPHHANAIPPNDAPPAGGNEQTRRSTRHPKYSKRYLEYMRSIAKQAIWFGLSAKTNNSKTRSQPIEPSSYLEANSCADSNFWIPAIIEEYDSLMQIATWTRRLKANGC